jgi:endonuclease/exonuclease/phosphatase family metal-dependent hydrolase
MFSYTHTKLRALEATEPFSGFRRYEADYGGLRFNVAGVWPWATKSAKTSYRQAHDGLRLHESWIRDRPTVILGDFNANASYKGGNWSQLLELTQSLGLVSAYHSHFKDEPFGKEKRPTHFHRGKESAPFHLDYIFLPEDWARRITKVTVGTHSDWHKVSDHSPLVVDLAL